MAKYIRKLTNKTPTSQQLTTLRRVMLKLETQPSDFICNCPEAVEGEHECKAIFARDKLSIFNSICDIYHNIGSGIYTYCNIVEYDTNIVIHTRDRQNRQLSQTFNKI